MKGVAGNAQRAWLRRDAKRAKQLRDGRTADQRQPDALVDLARSDTGTAATGAETQPGNGTEPTTDTSPGRTRSATSGTGTSGRLRPQVNVIVALSTLLGLDNQPGELDGHGPVPTALARALAFDPTGTWRRLLSDETG